MNYYTLNFIYVDIPKPCLRLNRFPAGVAFWKTTCLFQKGLHLTQNEICMGVRWLWILGMASDRREPQNYFQKWLNFILNSRIDPSGDQNDVQYSALYFVYVVYLVLYLHTVVRTYLYTVCIRLCAISPEGGLTSFFLYYQKLMLINMKDHTLLPGCWY